MTPGGDARDGVAPTHVDWAKSVLPCWAERIRATPPAGACWLATHCLELLLGVHDHAEAHVGVRHPAVLGALAEVLARHLGGER